MLTFSLKQKDIKKKWYLIDADGLVLGRLAAKISMILRGKHKTTYTSHLDCGDNVVVINAKGIRLTGSKEKKKSYFKHTGYPGGIKDITPYELEGKKKYQEILKLAVKRMLPGGPLAKKQLSKLKIYYGEKHPHSSQNPIEVNFSKINRKNKI